MSKQRTLRPPGGGNERIVGVTGHRVDTDSFLPFSYPSHAAHNWSFCLTTQNAYVLNAATRYRDHPSCCPHPSGGAGWGVLTTVRSPGGRQRRSCLRGFHARSLWTQETCESQRNL